MTDHMMDIQPHLNQVQHPRFDLTKIARGFAKAFKRVNSALARALLKGEPSWMMFK